MSHKTSLVKCIMCNNSQHGNDNNNSDSNDNTSEFTNTIMYQFGNYVVRNILYHLLKFNNCNGKYLRRLVFSYLIVIKNLVKFVIDL